MTLETLSENLIDSKVKYINELFQDETLMVDVADKNYISVVHHTFITVSYNVCKRVANHIRRGLNYNGTIYVGAYNFSVSEKLVA
jgi:hypothetical protein